MTGSAVAVDVSADLVFADKEVELEYRNHHTDAQHNLDIQFHRARALTWAAVGVRMLRDSSAYRHYIASLIVLTGAITTMIPAWAHSWFPKHKYVHLRPAVLLADNILQVALGCFTHSHIYPENASSWRDAAPWRAAAVLLSGSGVSWLNMSGLLGSMIFRFAMAQQAALAIIMLLASPQMCHRSFSLQKGHMVVHAALTRRASRLLPFYDTIATAIPLLRIPDLVPGSTADADYALNICLTYQPIHLLLLGLIAPTFYLFVREMRSRAIFASEFIANRVPGCTGVIFNPPPSLFQYWAFAAPACAALYYYVAMGFMD